jgi:quinol-cytochrome oxidoreductase complex cytochrome b subunit
MRFLNSINFSFLNNHLIDYPTPININYLWSFGSLAGLCLLIQIVSGVCLVMHYTPHTEFAFKSVEHIMRDVNWGWLIRYIHANGASLFFIIIYLHIGRGLYFRSYLFPRIHLWNSGVLIFLLLMATGFLGYVLPWGQMSFWGATVITNLFSAIPYIGPHIAYWLWGGFSVDNATLQRFFSLHYLLPFLISGLAIIHILLLHIEGSSNPLGVSSKHDVIPFYPYYYTKDLFGFFSLMAFFSLFVFFYPNFLAHPDNYIQANPMVTPTHIVPEWYFLPFYAILRSIPNKLGGVICMFLAIIILFSLPYVDRGLIKSPRFKPLFKMLFWNFASIFIFLGWLGAQVVEEPFIFCGQVLTVVYFMYFLFFLPVSGILENFFIFYYNFYKVNK